MQNEFRYEYPQQPKVLTAGGMSLEEAKQEVIRMEENFPRKLEHAYRRFRGKATREQLFDIVAHFFYYTFDLYVLGDCVKYPDRDNSFQAFSDWLKTEYPKETAARIFKSVDSVVSYT